MLASTTLVHTLNTMKPIDEVVVGDMIIDMNGEFKKVKKIYFEYKHQNMFKIEYVYCGINYPTICSADQKILIRSNNDIKWVTVSEIKDGDCICVPRIKTEETIVKYDLAKYLSKLAHKVHKYIDRIELRRDIYVDRFITLDYLFGQFVGIMYSNIGNIGEAYDLTLTGSKFNPNFTECKRIFEQIADKFNSKIKYLDAKRKGMEKLIMDNKALWVFVRDVCYLKEEDAYKRFNTEFYSCPEKFRKGIIDGMFLAAPCSSLENVIEDSSYEMLNAIKLLALSTNKGIIKYSFMSESAFKHLNGYKIKPYGIAKLVPAPIGFIHIYNNFADDNYWFLPIKKIKKICNMDVKGYTVETENSNGFLVNNIITKGET